MPSWNIHIAQTEQLMARGGAVARAVRDRNAFLFGALAPDMPVGYMMPLVHEPIAYRITHVADPAPIPIPREHDFWMMYVEPELASMGAVAADDGAVAEAADSETADPQGALDIPSDLIKPASITVERETVNRVHYPWRYEGVTEQPPVLDCPGDNDCSAAAVAFSRRDLVLGAWTHLVADGIWNTRVNEHLDAIGGTPNEQFRIKKQRDFDWFGKTLPISTFPRDTPRLIAAAATLLPYSLDERCVRLAVGVAHEIVRQNQGALDHPPYRLLTSAFFDAVFAEVVETTDRLLEERIV